MKAADEFLAAYNRIDQLLRTYPNVDSRGHYAQVVKDACSSSKIVKVHCEKLLKYGELRNVIVHRKDRADFVIAEPHEEVVEDIQRLEGILRKPRKFPSFKAMYSCWIAATACLMGFSRNDALSAG